MLDQNDLKQIGAVVKENNKELTKDIIGQVGTLIEENNKKLTKEVVLQVGEFIDQNVLPAIGEFIDEKLETKLEEKLTEKLRPLPDRDFITRQTAVVKGEFVAKLRKEDEKANLHIKFSHENKILTDEQWKALRALQVFPSIEI